MPQILSTMSSCPAATPLSDADYQRLGSQVLAAIDALLARAGTDKSKILRCQIFLADLADFAAMNEV